MVPNNWNNYGMLLQYKSPLTDSKSLNYQYNQYVAKFRTDAIANLCGFIIERHHKKNSLKSLESEPMLIEM